MSVCHPLDCMSCMCRPQTEWRHLDEAALQLLSRARVINRYRAGQVIFYQGNPPLGLYCVCEGQVILRKTDIEGRSVIVRLVSKGQTLGYRAFFSGQPYASSAEAVSDCAICWIDRSVVERLSQENPAILRAFFQHAASDLLEAEELHLRACTLSVKARLAHFLIMMKDRDASVDDRGQIVLELKLSRQDMAALLGTTPETVARTIRQLSESGVAVFDRRMVVVPDLDRLLDEAEQLS